MRNATSFARVASAISRKRRGVVPPCSAPIASTSPNDRMRGSV